LLAARVRGRRLGGRVRVGRAARLGPNQRRALQLWRRARTQLVRAGIDFTAATTPQEAARKARIAEADDLVAACTAARWGGAALPAERARALLRGLEAALERR